jgi:hypothetical protein
MLKASPAGVPPTTHEPSIMSLVYVPLLDDAAEVQGGGVRRTGGALEVGHRHDRRRRAHVAAQIGAAGQLPAQARQTGRHVGAGDAAAGESGLAHAGARVGRAAARRARGAGPHNVAQGSAPPPSLSAGASTASEGPASVRLAVLLLQPIEQKHRHRTASADGSRVGPASASRTGK